MMMNGGVYNFPHNFCLASFHIWAMFLYAVLNDCSSNTGKSSKKYEYYKSENLVDDGEQVTLPKVSGSQAKLMDDFKRGHNVIYLFFRKRDGKMLVVFTGTFPGLGIFMYSDAVGLVDLFDIYGKERKQGPDVGYGRDEHTLYIEYLNRDSSDVLAKFTGLQLTVGKGRRKTIDVVLRELYSHCPDNNDVHSGVSCMSSLSGISSARSLHVSGPTLRESDEETFFPIFNPLKKCRFGDSYSRGVIKFGRRRPTIFHAFLDGLKLVRPDFSVCDKGLSILLRDSWEILGSVCDLASDNKIRIYEPIFYEGIESTLDGKLISSAYANAYFENGRSDEPTRKGFSTGYIREGFVLEGKIMDYQLSALCHRYQVNVELYDEDISEGPNRKNVSARCASIDKFYFDSSYPAIKILRGGTEFVYLSNNIVYDAVSRPSIFYSTLFPGGLAPFDQYEDDYVYRPLRSELDPCPVIILDSSDILSSWSGDKDALNATTLFFALACCLKKRIRSLSGRSDDYRWMLNDARVYILNVLDRIDEDDRTKVYDSVYTKGRADSDVSVFCPSCVMLAEYGELDFEAEPLMRKLYAWMYLIGDFRTDCRFYQLAALCQCYEINVQLIYIRKDPVAGRCGELEVTEQKCDGSSFYYSRDYQCIQIVELSEYITVSSRNVTYYAR